MAMPDDPPPPAEPAAGGLRRRSAARPQAPSRDQVRRGGVRSPGPAGAASRRGRHLRGTVGTQVQEVLAGRPDEPQRRAGDHRLADADEHVDPDHRRQDHLEGPCPTRRARATSASAASTTEPMPAIAGRRDPPPVLAAEQPAQPA